MHKSPMQNGALITTIIGRLGPSPAERVDRVVCTRDCLSRQLLPSEKLGRCA